MSTESKPSPPTNSMAPPGSTNAPKDQMPGHPSFRRFVPADLQHAHAILTDKSLVTRQRASRACEVSFPYVTIQLWSLAQIADNACFQTCHARKVRCDAASLGVPCTNCVAFSIECKIPAPKRKKTAGKKETDRYVLVCV
jgi:hypothetical protein